MVGVACAAHCRAEHHADVALLMLMYTVAAYRPRRDSILVLAAYAAGSFYAIVTWGPVRGINLLERALVISVLFFGSALIAWVLGDSMRYRRGYYAALEDKAARLEAERHAQAEASPPRPSGPGLPGSCTTWSPTM